METNLTESALELFSNFSEIMEYDLGESKENVFAIFAQDLYTSSPTPFINGDVNRGEIDPRIIELVNRCSMSELRKIAKIEISRVTGQTLEGTASISEKLMAANTLLESGNRRVRIEDVVELATSGSSELIRSINNGNITSELIETLENGDFEYDEDEILEILESIATHHNSASICNYIESGLIASRDNLEDVIQAEESCVLSKKISF